MSFTIVNVPLGKTNPALYSHIGSLNPRGSGGAGGILVQAPALGTGAAAWTGALSSGGPPLTPFAAVLSSAITPSPAPVAPDLGELTATWSDGPAGVTLANFGVVTYAPPTGQGGTMLQAIDAAVLAAAVLYGADVLEDKDGSLRLLVAALWILWVDAGGAAIRNGGGGILQTLRQAVG